MDFIFHFAAAWLFRGDAAEEAAAGIAVPSGMAGVSREGQSEHWYFTASETPLSANFALVDPPTRTGIRPRILRQRAF